MRYLISLVLAFTIHTVLADDTKDTAYMMMVISSPSFSDMETVEKRYRFILPKLVQRCDDIVDEGKAGDMLYTAYKYLEEAGLENEEKLFDFSNTMFSMVSEIHPLAKHAKVPNRCAELFAMYVSGRREGMSSQETKIGVTDVVKTLYGLVQ